jgi:hypothetical protein
MSDNRTDEEFLLSFAADEFDRHAGISRTDYDRLYETARRIGRYDRGEALREERNGIERGKKLGAIKYIRGKVGP